MSPVRAKKPKVKFVFTVEVPQSSKKVLGYLRLEDCRPGWGLTPGGITLGIHRPPNDLERRVEALRQELHHAAAVVDSWPPEKREDAAAVMNSPGLSKLYEVQP